MINFWPKEFFRRLVIRLERVLGGESPGRLAKLHSAVAAAPGLPLEESLHVRRYGLSLLVPDAESLSDISGEFGCLIAIKSKMLQNKSLHESMPGGWIGRII